MSEQVKSQFPTEMIDLPSEGKLYPCFAIIGDNKFDFSLDLTLLVLDAFDATDNR